MCFFVHIKWLERNIYFHDNQRFGEKGQLLCILYPFCTTPILSIRENFQRSTPKSKPTSMFVPPLQCVDVPPPHTDSIFWYFMHLTPASTNSFKGLYLTKNYAKPIGPRRMVSRTFCLTINYLLMMTDQYPKVILCNYLLVKIWQSDKWMVNMGAKCSFYTRDLIRILICLFGFFSPFFLTYSQLLPAKVTYTDYRNINVNVSEQIKLPIKELIL